MTQRAMCLNVAGAGDRLTLGAYYRVVKELGAYIVVVDDWGDKTMFWADRFAPLPALKKVRVEYDNQNA